MKAEDKKYYTPYCTTCGQETEAELTLEEVMDFEYVNCTITYESTGRCYGEMEIPQKQINKALLNMVVALTKRVTELEK